MFSDYNGTKTTEVDVARITKIAQSPGAYSFYFPDEDWPNHGIPFHYHNKYDVLNVINILSGLNPKNYTRFTVLTSVILDVVSVR